MSGAYGAGMGACHRGGKGTWINMGGKLTSSLRTKYEYRVPNPPIDLSTSHVFPSL